MPSPFPGMDPYLEHPQLFPILHSSLIIRLMEMLQPILPEPYFAASNERVWLETSERYIEPDVHVGHSPLTQASDEEAHPVSGPLKTSPVLVSIPENEMTELFLEVYAFHGGQERVVTVVEILSPSNKVRGSAHREQYKRKQRELLQGKVNLVEIDLLRAGEHTTAAQRARIVEEAGEYDYHICLHRFYDRLLDFYVYPIKLESRLPEIDIPLLPQDGSIQVDIQSAFDHCYDIGPYRRRVRYLAEDLVPPLPKEQFKWASELLKKQGVDS